MIKTGIIECRPDGSYIYSSYRGILNLDNHLELEEAVREDTSLVSSTPSRIRLKGRTVSRERKKKK